MLLAQVAAPPGTVPAPRGGGVKIVSPPGSALEFKVKDMLPDKATASIKPGFQICSISIPLITLVAMFVLHIFLPVLVFLFNLWFLLKLRFCIPPSIELNAGLATQLKLAGELGVDLDASIGVSADIEAQLPDLDIGNPLAIQATIAADFDDALGGDASTGIVAIPPGFANTALAEAHVGIEEVATPEGEEGDVPGASLTAGVEWEEEVVAA
jgi:hypothetical protein